MITTAPTIASKSHSLFPPLFNRPRQRSLQCCIHHATAAAICSHAPARTPEKRAAPELQRHRARSPNRAADLSCGPPTPNPHN
jgi:hypothetical protein